jgi:hypothetical protein
VNREAAIRKESAHRRIAPLIDWCHVVRLPNGQHRRVNRFDYNTNERSSRYLQLADGAWIRADALVVVITC